MLKTIFSPKQKLRVTSLHAPTPHTPMPAVCQSSANPATIDPLVPLQGSWQSVTYGLVVNWRSARKK